VSLPILVVFALVLSASLLLIFDKIRPDLLALILLVTLGLTGLVGAQDLFSGFSRSAVITILALFIITDGLELTGATRLLGIQLRRLSGENEARSVVVVMIATAILSLAMNTIAAAAVLLPAVIGMTRQTTTLRPSKLLMPLAYGALLGGMATLFTTANLLVSASLTDKGIKPFGVLDFIPVGLPMGLAGILFMAFIGRRLLPDQGIGGQAQPPRRQGTLSETYGLSKTVSGVYVKAGSAMAGTKIAAGGWGQQLGLNVVGLSRGGTVRMAPSPNEEIIEGDVVLFTGYADQADLDNYGLVLTEEPGWTGQFVSEDVGLLEVVLSPRASLAGKTLREIHFRDKYDITVLAIWREGTTIREGLGDIPLRFGDALLMMGQRDKLALIRAEPEFIVLEEDISRIETPYKAALAVGLTTGAMVLAALNIVPIAEATLAAATLMILFKCLTMEQAYASIEWKTIFLIAGMIPLGIAMNNSGTAAFLGTLLVNTLGQVSPLVVAGGLFLVAMLLTQVMSGQATALVVAPIAIATGLTLGVDPRGLAMAVAMGCSTAFLTPYGHAANMLVMGPGGYTVKDYAKVGLPLTLVLFVTLLITLPLFWNIH